MDLIKLCNTHCTYPDIHLHAQDTTQLPTQLWLTLWNLQGQKILMICRYSKQNPKTVIFILGNRKLLFNPDEIIPLQSIDFGTEIVIWISEEPYDPFCFIHWKVCIFQNKALWCFRYCFNWTNGLGKLQGNAGFL